MARLPLVLVHGYSDRAESFEPWVRALTARGYDVAAVHVCTYRSLTNEISIRDVAEGFDRALRLRVGLNADEEFDAIVHSTGMLVVRAWLTAYANRRDRLKHLIGLAPASFGSPSLIRGAVGWARSSREAASSDPISSRQATAFSTGSSSAAASRGIWPTPI